MTFQMPTQMPTLFKILPERFDEMVFENHELSQIEMATNARLKR